MHIPSELLENGQLNLEKFAAYHMRQLNLFLPKLEIETLHTYDEFRKIVDEIYQWEYIAELIYSLDKRFENQFTTLFSEMIDVLVGIFEFFLGKIDNALYEYRKDESPIFRMHTINKIIDKLNLIKGDLRKRGLIDKLNPKIEEIYQTHKIEHMSKWMGEGTKKRSGLAKEITILIVEFALIVSFLVGLTYLGDPFLYEPPDYLSFISPQVYQGIALGVSSLLVLGFIIGISYRNKSLEYLSSFFQLSGLTFGAILLLVQFGLVQFGVWSALYVFLFIIAFYTIFALGSRKLTIIILIMALIIEFILVSIYLIDFWVDSFQFMSDFWVSRFIIADIAIVFSWIGSYSLEKTLKETPYDLKV